MTSYHLKRILFHGREVPIVLQNENGPCPLLAIANILLLRGAISLPANAPDVSQERLMQMVAEFLLDSNKVDEGAPLAANQQKNLGDVISALPKLATGVDVNPQFNSIRGFEFTDEVAIFDLFSVSLVHGWLADPSCPEIASYTYNQLVGKLVAIMGDETPAHLLTPQSSFASRGGQGSTELTGQSATSEKEEADLIQLDETKVRGGSQGEAEPGLGSIPEQQSLVDPRAEVGMDGGDLSTGAPATGVEDVTVQVVGADLAGRQEGSDSNPSPLEGDSDNVKADDKESLEAREKHSSDKAFSRRLQDWLEDTSSQLTYHGLASLHEGLKDEQLAVFFRNNHFNTILKQGRGLYLLVTDQGYMSESGVVWEKLDAVDGDTQLVNHEFVPYTKTEHVAVSSQDIELQQALAASLEMSNNGGGGHGANFEQRRESNDHGLPDDFLVMRPPAPPRPMGGSDADLALAMQLQEEELEEERRAVAAQEVRARQNENQRQMVPRHRRGSGSPNDRAPPVYSQEQQQELPGVQKNIKEFFKKLFTFTRKD